MWRFEHTGECVYEKGIYVFWCMGDPIWQLGPVGVARPRVRGKRPLTPLGAPPGQPASQPTTIYRHLPTYHLLPLRHPAIPSRRPSLPAPPCPPATLPSCTAPLYASVPNTSSTDPAPAPSRGVVNQEEDLR